MISEPALARELEAVLWTSDEPDYAAMAHLVAERYGPVVKAGQAIRDSHAALYNYRGMGDCSCVMCAAMEALAAVEGKE